MPQTRPSFIFFMPDTQRAESLGCYGRQQNRNESHRTD